MAAYSKKKNLVFLFNGQNIGTKSMSDIVFPQQFNTSLKKVKRFITKKRFPNANAYEDIPSFLEEFLGIF